MLTLPRLAAVTTTMMVCLLAGCDSGAPPAPASPATAAAAVDPPWFEEVARQRGIDFHHQSGHREKHYMPEIMGGGAALFDMDSDGDLDAYLVQSGSLYPDAGTLPPNRLFRNRGNGQFDDITDGSGAEVRRYGMGVACGDYDNDGDIDLYVTNVGPNVLLRNDGPTAVGHAFTDVTDQAGVGDDAWGTSAAFLDYDEDGFLDLYVCNYLNWSMTTELSCYNDMGGPDYCSPKNYNAPAMDVLLRNRGDGTFENVTVRAGIDRALGTGLGVACGDFNADGWLDIFVANDGMENILWINRGDGTFTNQAMILGCAVDQEGKAKAGMGVTVADVDDDADLDLLVCNLNTESDSFYRNDGRYFSDATVSAGLAVSRPFTRFGMGWLDFNNDGWLDLYQANGRVMRQSRLFADDAFAEPNLLFAGSQDGRFREVQPRGGTASLLSATSRAAAFGDIDNDGGIDVLVVNRDGPAHLLHNIAPSRGNWIAFRVVDEHGRDALNATLTASLGPRTITHDVRAAYSYLASNDPRVHVGLGEAERLANVSVRWLDGTIQNFGDFPAGAVHTLRRAR